MEEAINSYLTFMINGGLYGIHVSKVVEIMAYETPQAQTTGLNYMLGFVQHRGRVLPLIDSGLKFGQKPIELTPQSYVVVIAVRNADAVFDSQRACTFHARIKELSVGHRRVHGVHICL